ncbi:INO80 complex subunit B [Rhizophlyctis rosea]|uniref:INO80 complex subunit B n=1 Tax=Rhizophlyctis rosea TaxID=64517 RepID=A0AAD5S5I2_9FUNG|nr:INO80 complex subunit B [Rhizophlyctis rosea]
MSELDSAMDDAMDTDPLNSSPVPSSPVSSLSSSDEEDETESVSTSTHTPPRPRTILRLKRSALSVPIPSSDNDSDEDDGDSEIDESVLEQYRNRAAPTVDDDEESVMTDERPKKRTAPKGKKGTKKKVAISKGSAKKGKKAPPPPPSGSESEDESLGSEGEVASLRMTARQRALATGEDTRDSNLELPDERASKKKHLTAEEMALRRSETARRRKNQADQKAEDDKLATIAKLLKKQASKRRTKETDAQGEEELPDRIRYVQRVRSIANVDTQEGETHKPSDTVFEAMLAFPAGVDVVLARVSKPLSCPAPRLCAVAGCKNIKRYNHSKSGQPCCSLEHYRLLEA